MPVTDSTAPPRLYVPVLAGEEALLADTLASLRAADSPLPVRLLNAGADLGSLPAEDFLECLDLESLDNPLTALGRLPESDEGGDILYVRPGVRVPRFWSRRLAWAAAQNPAIAVVAPLNDAHPLSRLLEPSHGDQDLAVVDGLVQALADHTAVQVPLLPDGCLYLRESALSALRPLLSDERIRSVAELCQALQRLGCLSVLCPQVYVEDRGAVRQAGEPPPGQREVLDALLQAHPLTGLRHAVNDALSRRLEDSLLRGLNRPTQLHIVHSWGGGVERWLRDYIEADRTRRNLVLRSIGVPGTPGQAIGLYEGLDMTRPLRYWPLSYPIRHTATAHLAYGKLLTETVQDFAVEAVIVSSLIGHSLDALDTGLPTVFLTHDYYPFCPALNIHFGEVCTSCDAVRLTQCFAGNPHNRFFTPVPAPDWLALRQRFVDRVLSRDIRLVAPSASVPRHLHQLLPALAQRPFHIVPHGIALAHQSVPARPRSDGRLKLVVLGSLAPHKGRELLRRAYDRLHPLAELYLLGCGEDGEMFAGLPGVHVTPRYDYEELADRLTEIAPDAGLLLSILPETFSYTLSELWTLGIPPLATRVGSFAERIEDGVNGFLCRPDEDDLVRAVAGLANRPQRLGQVRRHRAEHRQPDPGQMVARYHRLLPLPPFDPRRNARRLPAEAASESGRVGVLSIDPQARFADVLRSFWRYSLAKLVATPRLSGWRKTLILNSVHGLARLVRQVGAWRRPATRRGLPPTR